MNDELTPSEPGSSAIAQARDAEGNTDYDNQVFNAVQMAADSLSELIPFAKRMGESPDDCMVGMAEEAMRRCEAVAKAALWRLYPNLNASATADSPSEAQGVNP